MILQYSCRNFRSIGEEILFSMKASSDTSLDNNLFSYKPELKILKEGIIYGANGSGKTNFIRSLSFFKAMVVGSHNNMPGSRIIAFKNKRMIDKDTEFSMHFISNGMRYLYGFSYNEDEIVEEYLYCYPNNRIKTIFVRSKDKISYGDAYKKDLSDVNNNSLKPNRLMLSCAADQKNIKEITDVYVFFNAQLVIYEGQFDWNLYSANVANQNVRLRNIFVEFLHNVGKANLKDVSAKVEEKPFPENHIPPFLTDEFRKQLQSGKTQSADVKFNYDGYSIDLRDESQGIQKLFALFFPFVDIIINKKVFICDEFETHIHPLIVRELLKLFEENATESQIIITTHDVNLLDLSLFRRDQIWFTEQTPQGFTDLYSLVELKSVRKDENISKNYILGKYSGVPMINENIKTDLLKEVLNDGSK